MPLKMLGVCSSLQDQQFWLLNHSISSSYEEVMIKVSQWKSRTILQKFQIWYCSSCEKMEGREIIWGGKMRGKLVQILGGLWPVHVWPACATRGQRGALAVWHTWSTRGHPLLGFWPSDLLAHLSRSSAVFGHPNSEFESVFGLRTVTPSRTTTTMKLWKMVENSSRKTTTNTTQRMRTKSSVATSFGLET